MACFLLFFYGLLIGFIEPIVPGPMAMVCIQRTLSNGRKSGFVTGLGIALADLLYAVAATLFLGLVLSFIEKNMDILKIISGLCIMILGLQIFLKNPVRQIRKRRINKGNLWNDFLSVFFITITNPSIILIFMALFAAFGVPLGTIGTLDVIFLLFGVLVGNVTWWFTLTSLVNIFRNKFRLRYIHYMNKFSGAAIALLGLLAILSFFIHIPSL